MASRSLWSLLSSWASVYSLARFISVKYSVGILTHQSTSVKSLKVLKAEHSVTQSLTSLLEHLVPLKIHNFSLT